MHYTNYTSMVHLVVSIRVDLLFDGKVLPSISVRDTGVLFYDMVLSQNGRTIIKFPFDNRTDKLKRIELFSPGVSINVNAMDYSGEGSFGRLPYDTEFPLEVHVFKVYFVDNVLGYRAHIGENSEQDTPIYTINLKSPVNNVGAFTVRYGPDGDKLFKAKDTLSISNHKWFGPRWNTQKPFYGSCHVTGSTELQHYDLKQLFEKFFSKAKDTDSAFVTLKDVLVKVATTVADELIYKNDEYFATPGRISDYGDASIEVSRWGDCEDFAHFYMRIFRMLMGVYRWGAARDTRLFKHCRTFAEEYIPLVYICKVVNNGKVDYHSTMLILPKRSDKGYKTISFEVTNPALSLDLGVEKENEEFIRWHTDSYFLVDNLFIAKIFDANVGELSIEKIRSSFFNY